MEEVEIEEIPVPINNDLERRVADAFEVFDTQENKTVDVSEIATIIRGLGICPSEAEIQEIILQIEDPKYPGLIHLANFLPKICQILVEHRHQPASADTLLEAFRFLDTENRGFVTVENLSKLMMEYGEPFNQDELEEMLEIAIDPHTQKIPYEYYINQILYQPCTAADAYKLADRVESEKTPPPTPPRTFSQMMALMRSSTEL